MVFLSRQVYARIFRIRRMEEGAKNPDRTNKKNFIFRMTWVLRPLEFALVSYAMILITKFKKFEDACNKMFKLSHKKALLIFNFALYVPTSYSIYCSKLYC